ncbi:MAG: hypothetical protein IT553_07445 [Sphingomonadaceae bacterium]|nr:hypothetical protein [Sphingomonadaceae bacterium]
MACFPLQISLCGAIEGVPRQFNPRGIELVGGMSVAAWLTGGIGLSQWRTHNDEDENWVIIL